MVDFMDVVNTLEDNITIVSKRVNSSFEEIGEIYNALVALDEEYIAGIVGATKQAVEAANMATDNQHDIKKTIDYLKLTVEKLNKVSESVNYQLSQICGEKWQDNTGEQLTKIKEINDKFVDCTNQINEIRESTRAAILDLKSGLDYEDKRINELYDKINDLYSKDDCLTNDVKDLNEQIRKINDSMVYYWQNTTKKERELENSIVDTKTEFENHIKESSQELSERIDIADKKINKQHKQIIWLIVTLSICSAIVLALAYLLLMK